MPFNPINYGNILAQTEGIQGARMNNALNAQRLDPNSIQNQLAQAQIGKLQREAAGGGVGMAPISFKDATGDSIAEFQRTGDPSVLERHYTPYKPWTVDTKTHKEFWDIDVNSREPILIQSVPINNFDASRDAELGNLSGQLGGIPSSAEGITGGQSPDMGLGGGNIPPQNPPSVTAAPSAAELETKRQTAIEEVKNRAAVKSAYSLDDAKTVIQAQNKLGVMLTQDQKLDKVIELSENGAKTGPIMRYLPTLTAQTAELENMQRGMGLDVVGSVTFGALSKGELDLALVTALPTNLSGPDLVKWAKDKQSANRKLGKYLMDQIKFIRAGGTSAQWMEKVQSAGGINQAGDAIEGGIDFSTLSDAELQELAR